MINMLKKCSTCVQLVRVSSFRNDLLQNPYFSDIYVPKYQVDLSFNKFSQGEFTIDCVIYWNVGMYVLLPIDHLFIKSARTIFFEQ